MACSCQMNKKYAGGEIAVGAMPKKRKQKRKQKGFLRKGKIGSIDGVMENLPILGAAAAGIIVTAYADTYALDKVSFLQTNPMLKNFLKLGVGAYLTTMDNNLVQGLGLGLGANAAYSLIKDKLPAITGVAGLYPGSGYSQPDPIAGLYPGSEFATPDFIAAAPIVTEPQGVYGQERVIIE